MQQSGTSCLYGWYEPMRTWAVSWTSRLWPCLQGHPPAAGLIPAILSSRTGIWAVNNVMVKPIALSRGHQRLENKGAEAQPKMLFSRGKTSVLAWNTSPLELLPRAEDVAVKLNERGWLWDSLLAACVCASPLQGRTCLWAWQVTASSLHKYGEGPRMSLARTS